MKLLFATNHFYPPQSAGGSESSTHDLCISLKRKSINCAVLADLGSTGLTWLRNRIKSKITSKKYPDDNTLGYPVFRGWNPIEGVDEVIESFNPNVAVIQAGQPLLLANAFIQNGIPTVVYLRDVAFDKHGGDYKSHPLLHFLANSQFTAKAFERFSSLEAKVIPPLVSSENYRVTPTRQKVVFICPSPLKGVELAFRLAESNPEIPFAFIESWFIPPDRKREYIQRAERSGNIEWMEKQRDMKLVYSQAKILLVPSMCNEAWGRVVTESQVSGIPTLASNRGGLPESVGDGGILLDPEGNFEKWDESLKKLWFDDHFYQCYCDRALEYSRREAIQPDYLISEFLDFARSIQS
ncbi:glycosyltransferase [Methylocaldum gracile subsp. desertum]|uniref:glycosyltransferase n=1 Tax=Methylocaldum sp. GT1BW TaxID=3438964 RepID=UPI003DA0B87A